MIKKMIRFICVLLLSLQSTHSIALADPVQLLQQLTHTVMSQIDEKADHLKQHPNELYAIVDTTVCPHVDFVEMARWVVGRNAWRDANEAERQSFIAEFKTLVIRNYAHSLLEYVEYTFEFLPLRTDPQTQKRLEVLTKVKGDGRILNMEYRLVRENDVWKVYDIIFEHVSLVQGYRAQFAEDIQRNGVKAVIETLHTKNARAHHTPSEPLKEDG